MAWTLRTDDEMEQALDRLTTRQGKSRQEVVRHLVLAEAQLDSKAESLDRVLARWGSVLDRLGKA